MSNIRSYMFVPGNREQGLKKPFSKEITDTTNIILDLEDAVNDPTNEKHSAKLKDDARNLINEFLCNNKTVDFFVRVNKIGSEQWDFDKDWLAKFTIEMKKRLKGIVIPKVTGPEDIKIVKKWLESNSFRNEVIPLVETKEGMEQLFEISKIKEVKSVIFGHHDYFYDIGEYPIPNSALTSEKYREKLRYFIQTLNGSGKELIDGIYPYLKDSDGMKRNCQFILQMAEGTDLHIAKLALNPDQAKTIYETEPKEDKITIDDHDDNFSEIEKKYLAEKIIDIYNKREENLGVTRVEDYYLSPQQYLSSKKYLDKQDEKTKEKGKEFPKLDLH